MTFDPAVTNRTELASTIQWRRMRLMAFQITGIRLFVYQRIQTRHKYEWPSVKDNNRLLVSSPHKMLAMWKACLCNDVMIRDLWTSCCIPPRADVHALCMMMSSNGNIFRVTAPLCGEFTGDLWIPRISASDMELWCFLWSAPNKWLSKQSWGWWFETLSHPLWRQCNGAKTARCMNIKWQKWVIGLINSNTYQV